MKAAVGYPVVIFGPIANGTMEHPGLVTRVWTHDHGYAVVNAVMFPDGGGDVQFKAQLRVYDTKDEAIKFSGPWLTAYWPQP